jgi:hypothetical protein
MLTEGGPPTRNVFIPLDQSALNTQVTSRLALNQPMQSTPLADGTLSRTSAAPIAVSQSAAASPSDPAVLVNNDEMIRLIKRGKDFLKEGDFVSARLLFKRAADAGRAEAALALGSTYDPSVITQLGAVSVNPDVEIALQWYGIAAGLGSAEAANRFANLMQARQTRAQH